MSRGTRELKDAIPSGGIDEELLEKIKDQWLHDDFRKRVLTIVTEHEGTHAFEKVVWDMIGRYLKIKTSERVYWILGIVLTAFVTWWFTR